MTPERLAELQQLEHRHARSAKLLDKAQRNVALDPATRHSQKPETLQDRLELMFTGPFLELFARRQRPGWTCLGNEIDGRDIRDSLIPGSRRAAS